MRIGNHDTHPICDSAPTMDEERFASLVESIEANGQRRPIVLFDGLILDGRHRYLACIKLGIEPQFDVYQGDEPELLAFDLNYEQRDVNQTVRTMGATRLESLARKRRRLAKDARRERVQRRLPVERDPDIAFVAAEGVDELQQAVATGDITVAKAREIAELDDEEQRAILDRASRPEPTRARAEHAETYRAVAIEVSPVGREALRTLLRKTQLRYGNDAGAVAMAHELIKEAFPWL